MKESQRIADQLDRAYRGPAWHGPSLSELLAGLDAAAAAARPLPGAHSIWEIVRHLAVWNEVPRRRIEGEPLDSLPPEEDWPAVADPTPRAWREAQEALAGAHRRLAELVLGLDEARLRDPIPGSGPTVWAMLHGVVQHNLYHAGQIALLRKAAGRTAARS
jgi:uncharacterized damage-inducible protein DinB